jgi:hypothetical protein
MGLLHQFQRNDGASDLVARPIASLDGTLPYLFTRWYPGMAVNDNQVPALAMAA